MRRSPFLLLIVLFVAVSLTIAAPAPPATAQDAFSPGRFIPDACVMDLPDGAVEGIDIVCGYIFAPESHAVADGQVIQLPIAILPATGANPEPDPLFMAQGGPGGSTLNLFVQLLVGTPVGDILRSNRDIVLVEQRGTLYAEPNLGCPELVTLTYESLNTNPERDAANAAWLDAVTACADRLRAAGIDLSAYDSLQNAEDMNLAREALGYEQINFYGVSYGTMLVQHYMRAYPDTLRTAVIDAVVPLATNFVTEYPANAQRAFDAMFAACVDNTGCNTAYPTLESDFYATVERLNDRPASILIFDEAENRAYDDLFSGDDLMYLVFSLMYSTTILPYIPRIINDVVNDQYNLAQSLEGFYTFNFTLARGMYYSVICAEDADFTDADVNTTGIRQEVASAFRVDLFAPVCDVWEVDTFGAEIDEPVSSDIPTLVMSGEFDPITPPINGKVAAQTLENAYVYTFPGVGHGAFDTPCGLEIMMQFLNEPMAQPDSTCLGSMGISFEIG